MALTAVDSAKKKVKSIASSANTSIRNTADKAQGMGKDAWRGLSKQSSKAWRNLSGQAGDTWKKVSGQAGDTWKKISGQASNTWKNVSGKASKTWDDTSEKATDFWGKTKDFTSDTYQTAVEKGNEFKDYSSQKYKEGKKDLHHWSKDRNQRIADTAAENAGGQQGAESALDAEDFDYKKYDISKNGAKGLMKDSIKGKAEGAVRGALRDRSRVQNKMGLGIFDKFDKFDYNQMMKAQSVMDKVTDKFKLTGIFKPENMVMGAADKAVKEEKNTGGTSPLAGTLTAVAQSAEKNPATAAAGANTAQAQNTPEAKALAATAQAQGGQGGSVPQGSPEQQAIQDQIDAIGDVDYSDKKAKKERAKQVKEFAADTAEVNKYSRIALKKSMGLFGGGAEGETGPTEESLRQDALKGQIMGNYRGISEIATGGLKLTGQIMNYEVEKDEMDKWDRTSAIMDMVNTGTGMAMGATRLGLVNSGDDAHSSFKSTANAATGQLEVNGNDQYMSAAALAKSGINVATNSVQVHGARTRVNRMQEIAAREKEEKTKAGLSRSKDEKAQGISRLDAAKASQEKLRAEIMGDSNIDESEKQSKADEAVEEKRKAQIANLEKNIIQKTAIAGRTEERNKAWLGLGKSLFGFACNAVKTGVGLGAPESGIAGIAKMMNKYGGKAIGFIGGKLVERESGKFDEKLVNKMIDLIKLQGGERAKPLSDVKDYGELKHKIRVGYSIMAKGENDDSLNSLTDGDFKTIMSHSLSGEVGGKRGIVNAMAKRSAAAISEGQYKDDDNMKDFLKASGVVGKGDKLPSKKTLEQRLGVKKSLSGTFEGYTDEFSEDEMKNRGPNASKYRDYDEKKTHEANEEEKAKAEKKKFYEKKALEKKLAATKAGATPVPQTKNKP